MIAFLVQFAMPVEFGNQCIVTKWKGPRASLFVRNSGLPERRFCGIWVTALSSLALVQELNPKPGQCNSWLQVLLRSNSACSKTVIMIWKPASAWKTDALGGRVHACAYVRYLCVHVLPFQLFLKPGVFVCVVCT